MRKIKFKKNGECVGKTSQLDALIFKGVQKVVRPRIKQIYIDGDFVEDDLVSLAVVGSRRISSYGRRVCDVVVKELAAAGVTIVSGLMYGVDQAAHTAALDAGGRTIAVLGYGMNMLATNTHTQNLANRILRSNSGVIISEYASNYPPTKYTFPTRNRIVAAISVGTLIVEAGEKSGSKITASFAADYGKDVFVVPGSIFSNVSKGNHQLLKEGAIPVDSAKDILDYLGVHGIRNEKAKRKLKGVTKQVYEEINSSSEIRLDELSEITKIKAVDLSGILTSLELEGIIKRKVDGRIVVV